ncbi:uncharacterized protein PV09_09641 [Verruconis gallopava]|uniref:Uncharacterized protein n=1 Tax=Verruconis gallopava TaxID=253628 RepID=A0A0D1X925_9PEZI|nr:uncharacterized protein PV09_09641 [Verruconis gallopava]KIV98560.1 hypothetical protein PV09_09641 [Verruconis gallopava]
MLFFMPIPPWPQSIILPTVLTIASIGLTVLLELRRRDQKRARPDSSIDLMRLPLISLPVAGSALAVAVVTAVYQSQTGKASTIICTLYLQIGLAACLAYEGSAVILEQTHSFTAFFFWWWLRPSYALFLTSVSLTILIHREPVAINEATIAFLILTSVFDAWHIAQVQLTVNSSIIKPFDGKLPGFYTKTKRALSWLVKGFRLTLVSFWNGEESTRFHRKLFVLLIRNWVVFGIDVSFALLFCVQTGPYVRWILQFVSFPNLLSSVVWISLRRDDRPRELESSGFQAGLTDNER